MANLGLLPESAGYIAALSVLAAVATLAVGLRFWVTSVTRAGPEQADDQPLQISFSASLLYATASFAVKLAAIGFYFRIFPTRTTRWGCYVLAAICAIWFLLAVIVSFAACRHLKSGWDPTIKGYCINAKNYPITLAALNVVVDAATVALPIYEVSRLRLAKRKKYTVAGIFVIGGIATAASLARFIGLTFTLHPSPTIDVTQLSSLLSVLGVIEVYAGLIGACVPTLGPIYDKFRRGQSTSESGGNFKSSERQSKTYTKVLDRTTSRSRLRNEDDVEGSSERLEGASISSTTTETINHWTDMGRSVGANPSEVEDIPLRTIHTQQGKTVF